MFASPAPSIQFPSGTFSLRLLASDASSSIIASVEPADVPEEIHRRLAVRTPANHREITFLQIEELTDEERRIVPEMWLHALHEPGRRGVQLMLKQWELLLPRTLPRLTRRFTEAACDLILGRQFGAPVLVYVLQGEYGQDQYCTWVASPPRPISAIPQHLQRLPESILTFHTRLHDGFDGPLFHTHVLPFAHMESVGDYDEPGYPFEMFDGVDWDDGAPTLPAPADQPDWNEVVLIASNGRSGRLCATLDDTKSGADGGWYWFEGSMSPEPDIWRCLDTWLTHDASDWTYTR